MAHVADPQPPTPPQGDEAPTLPPGTKLGKYQLVSVLGAGGMGTVYRARHMQIGKQVALKLLAPSVAAIPRAREKFLREAQLASRVRHPNIVDVTDVGTEGEHSYIVMEYLEGEDLARRIGRTEGAGLSVPEIAQIMLPVAAAMVAAHAEGIIHRDLKPHNIFLSESPMGAAQPKVLDFGISKPMHDADGPSTASGDLVGTPQFLSPEQLRDPAGASALSDQYAMGVILYECATGRNPHSGTALFAIFKSIAEGGYPAPREVRPDIPEPFEQVIMRAMALDPQRRFTSVRELAYALLPFASPKTRAMWETAFPQLAQTRTYDNDVSKPVRMMASTRQRTWIALGVATALALTLLIAWRTHRPGVSKGPSGTTPAGAHAQAAVAPADPNPNATAAPGAAAAESAPVAPPSTETPTETAGAAGQPTEEPSRKHETPTRKTRGQGIGPNGAPLLE